MSADLRGPIPTELDIPSVAPGAAEAADDRRVGIITVGIVSR
jgi:hypothetical protein